MLLQSCWLFPNPGDDDEESYLEKEFLSVAGAEYHEGSFPAATIHETIDGISLKNKVLKGGLNLVTIRTDKVYKCFYIGVKGVPGYLAYTPEDNITRATSGSNEYTIPVMYSTGLDNSITMIIAGEDSNDDVTEPYEQEIDFVDSQTGKLHVNLTFENDKDVDLHLYMPNGYHIFYGNRGYTAETTGGETVTYQLLDHDSNAGCNIDGLEQENIEIPEELIQSGTYRVVVDMFKNCNTSIPTNWAITAQYADQLINVTSGSNPAMGTYPVGAGNGDMTTVMEFTINANRRAPLEIKENSLIPIPLNDMDMMKLEEAKFNMEFGK